METSGVTTPSPFIPMLPSLRPSNRSTIFPFPFPWPSLSEHGRLPSSPSFRFSPLPLPQNAGWSPLSLVIDKNSLVSAGFRVEPDKVVRLPGFPEPETVEFTVTLQSKTHKVSMGHHTQLLRLDLRPGPPVAILMRANITSSDLKLSEGRLDFRDVICGRARTMSVLLTNPKEVLADWIIRKPIEGAKDYSYFSFQPSSGVLSPGGQVMTRNPSLPAPPHL